MKSALILLQVMCVLAFSRAAVAQPAQSPSSSTEEQTPPPGHQGHQMPAPGHEQIDDSMSGPLGISATREGSGTAWLPDETPMYAIHKRRNDWTLMLHENVFVQYISESGDRGDDQFGSINWIMGMAQRPLAGGELQLRSMFSLEALTVGKCGYPDLLATGEFCHQQPLHDRQHPHDLFMEVAARYTRPLSSRLAIDLYGGPSGEPALGPVAYPHRTSAMPNPVAPIGHHWLDSTHISFGVATAGLFGKRWKVEGSVFNGREPDEDRYNFDLARLDSYSGRFWFLPTDRWALQVSAGHLKDGEQTAVDVPPENVNRVTASATYHRRLEAGSTWATTITWGRNADHVYDTNAFLAESAIDVGQANTFFARGEIVAKTRDDLVLPALADEVFTVGKLSVGYTRHLPAVAMFVPGVGGALSFSVVPDDLKPYYSHRVPVGFIVFINIRPMAMPMMAPGHHMASAIATP